MSSALFSTQGISCSVEPVQSSLPPALRLFARPTAIVVSASMNGCIVGVTPTFQGAPLGSV